MSRVYEKFVHFWLKIVADQICSKFDFSKILSRFENLIFLGGTKVFNLKTHERITHLLHPYRSDIQFYGASASEALAQV